MRYKNDPLLFNVSRLITVKRCVLATPVNSTTKITQVHFALSALLSSPLECNNSDPILRRKVLVNHFYYLNEFDTFVSVDIYPYLDD
jgi:hypothetical protein